ncbi:MAG: hypothetical protein Q4B09_00895 [Lachnospiraceae bacterium]|nr:hypothetical protein [Lachnospiraceae bacterium]
MEWNYLNHSIYIRSEVGRILGEIMFPETSPGVYDIENVHVAEEYIGSELPEQLIEAARKRIKEQGGRATASDPFARKYFSEHHL